MACAHEHKIVHRDLKPSNVMVLTDGSCKVMDFGVAHRSRTDSDASLSTVSGTPPYMAPEAAMGSVLTAADLYALAVMAYELLAGVRPFPGPDFLEQKLRLSLLPVTQAVPGLPSGLDAFFSRALQPDPTKRPPDVAAFLAEFDAACK